MAGNNYDFMGMANQQTQINRPNQTTPWGSTTWTTNPDGSQTQNTSLNPTQQQTLTGQQNQAQQRTDAAGGLIGQATSNFANPMDYSGFMAGGDRVNGGQYYYDAATNASRDKFSLWNDEQFNRDDDRLNQQLRNRGVNPGDVGYDQQLQQLRETQGKLRQSSNLDAILIGGQEGSRMQGMDIDAGNYNTSQRQSQEAEALRRRNQPLNEANALLEGQEVTMPEMPNAPAGGNVLQAGMLQDNQRQANKTRDAEMLGQVLGVGKALGGAGGIGGLIGSGLGAAGNAIGGSIGGALSGAGSFMGGTYGAATTAAATAGGGAAATGAGAAAAGAGAAGGAGTAGAGAAGAASGAAGGGGFMSGALAAAPWVAGALAAGLIGANQIPKSSPLDDSFDANTLSFTKPANFDGQKWSPQELNQFFGPALQVFAQTGDAKQALAAIPQPTNAREQTLLKGGAKSLFGGTGNPFRVIAKAKGFGEGIWTAGNKDKKAMIKELGG